MFTLTREERIMHWSIELRTPNGRLLGSQVLSMDAGEEQRKEAAVRLSQRHPGRNIVSEVYWGESHGREMKTYEA
jgi:uncharacterized protein YcsI (UPF0317 family)